MRAKLQAMLATAEQFDCSYRTAYRCLIKSSVVFHAQREGQRHDGAIPWARREASRIASLTTLRGGHPAAAPSKCISDHFTRVRLVIGRGGYERPEFPW